jgi:hypothetical protein
VSIDVKRRFGVAVRAGDRESVALYGDPVQRPVAAEIVDRAVLGPYQSLEPAAVGLIAGIEGGSGRLRWSTR